MADAIDPQKIRLTRHALERFAGWRNIPLSRGEVFLEKAVRGWMKSARPAVPVKERRAVAIIDHGADATYLLGEGFVAVIVKDEKGRGAMVTFHDNSKKWYTLERRP